MTPLKTAQGLETLFPAPANVGKTSGGKARQGPIEKSETKPFKDVLHSVDRNQSIRASAASSPEKLRQAESDSGEKSKITQDVPKTTNGTDEAKKTTMTEGEESDSWLSGLPEASQFLSPNPVVFAGGQAVLLENFEDPLGDGAFLQKENLSLLGIEGAEPLTEEILNPGTEVQKSEAGGEENLEGALSLKDIEAMDSEMDINLETEDIQEIVNKPLNSALQEKKAEIEAQTASKMVQEGMLKAEGKNSVLAEGTLSDAMPDMNREKNAESKIRPEISKGSIKMLSSDVLGLQQTTPMENAQKNVALSLSQKEALISQVSEQLKVFQPGKVEQIRFQLEPETLGSIQVEVSVQRGVVHAHILTGDPQVKLLLEANQAQLRERLAEQGFQVDQFSVDVGDTGKFFEEKGDAFPAEQNPQSVSEPVLKRPMGGFSPRSLGLPRQGLINVYG